jgi:hypothetical protein
MLHRSFFPVGKRPEREVDHWPLPSDEHKNKYSYTPSPPTCLHGMDRDNFTRWSRIRILGTHRKGRWFDIKFPTRNLNVIINPVADHCICLSISSSVKNDEEMSKDGTNETWYDIYTVNTTLERWTDARIPSCENNYTLYRDGWTAVK